MKWIAARQRIMDEFGSYEAGRIWASGYLLAKNGIDIINAFISIPLPSWHYGFSLMHDDYRMMQWELLYTRSRGWCLRLRDAS